MEMNESEESYLSGGSNITNQLAGLADRVEEQPNFELCNIPERKDEAPFTTPTK